MWNKLLKPVDHFVDGITMYRLLLYYLLGLLLAAICLSTAGEMHYSAVQIALSAGIAVFACWVINHVFAYIFSAPINPESSILTGLILALIIPPHLGGFGTFFILAASGLAIASKYLLTIGEKHIFNPAAIAVVLTAWGPRQSANWWIATAVMLPFIIIGGLLITRKMRREHMIITFLVITTITTAVLAVSAGAGITPDLHSMIASSPVFFLAFVMLTEPYTSPTTKGKQMLYAALVGFLIAPQVHVGHIYTSPESSLVIGNIFAYLISSKVKLFPVLQERIGIARNTFEFSFITDTKLQFKPGQYMEFTLPHSHPDSRGSRRWFTIASSPTEKSLKLGVKFYEKSSTYKTAMLNMDKQTPIVASQVAGDFTLPKDINRKLIFIAGGIGITPFRSMTKYLIDNKQQRPVRMLYGVHTLADLAYKEVFEEARQAIGMHTIYVLSDQSARQPYDRFTLTGKLSSEFIKHHVPDYADCQFYISGTHPLVESVQSALKELGVRRKNIKMDFFPGYA